MTGVVGPRLLVLFDFELVAQIFVKLLLQLQSEQALIV